MRIVHVISGLDTGGAEMILYKILSRMEASQFPSLVVSLKGDGEVAKKIRELGIPVHNGGLRLGKPNPLTLKRIIRAIREFQPDLLQGWMYHGNLAAQFARLFLPKRIPVVWSIHHTPYNLSEEKKALVWVIKLGAVFSKYPSKIHYVSQVSAEKHEALGYCPDSKLIIPNGFDADSFAPSKEARDKLRSELGIPAGAKIIGLIARYHPMKDHSNFIRAASLLETNGQETHFLMAGPNISRDNRDLYRLIEASNLESKCHLLGERSDMDAIMPALDIGTSSSAFGESFPLVVGEAMACGVPCVVTDVGGSSYLVGDAGRVVPAKNAEALARAWKEILGMGEKEREDLGRKARERVMSLFSLDRIVSQFESLYRGLAAN